VKIDRRKLLMTGAASGFAIGAFPDPSLPLCGDGLPERVSFSAPPIHRAISFDILVVQIRAQ
jgi:hypothetical protein